jgi:cyclic pyranopterin phosphate synthase
MHPDTVAAEASSSCPAGDAPLTHLDPSGQIRMVDVTEKAATFRQATAAGQVHMQPSTLQAILTGQGSKGNVMETARLAGIMAAKRTADLIPLCHPLPLTGITVQIDPDDQLPGFRIEATVKTTAQTGVEMEALTAVSVAALTLYDMAKALEKTMLISEIGLVQKIGGKSGFFERDRGIAEHG